MAQDRDRETGIEAVPVPDAAATAPAAGGALEEGVALEVTDDLRRLAVRRGFVKGDGVLRIPEDRYMAAASRLALHWSGLAPAVIETYDALNRGVLWPDALTRSFMDVLLVHDHQYLVARRDRLRAQERDSQERDGGQDPAHSVPAAAVQEAERVALPHGDPDVALSAGPVAIEIRDPGSLTPDSVLGEPPAPAGPDR